MIISKRFAGIALVAVVLLTACGKKAPSYTKYIPKDASNVISVDVKSLMVKLNSDSLSVENMMALLKDSTDNSTYTEALGKYKEFKDAGIDWDSKFYVSTSGVDMNRGGGNFTVEMVAAMKDAKKFEEFLKKQKETSDIKKGEGFSYAGNNEGLIGWNDEAVIIVYANESRSYDYDENGMSKPKAQDAAGGPAEKLKKFFKLTSSESIQSVDGFNDLQGKKADIAIFNQLNLDAINSMAFAFVPKLKDLLKGAYSTTIVNFEDGKAVVESTSFTGDKLAAVLKKYAGPEVDMSLLENYPSQNVTGAMAFSFNPQLIPALIKEAEVDAILASQLAQTGLTVDDFAKIFKGDFAVAVSDFTVEKKEMGKDAYTYTSEVPSAKMVFVAKIGDKKTFDRLVGMGEKQGAIVRNGDMILMANHGEVRESAPVVVCETNDLLIIASDSATLAAYKAKSQKIGLSDEGKSKLKGNAVGAFIDIEKILNGLSPSLFGSDESGMASGILARSKATFKNMSFSTQNFSGKSVSSKAEIVFGDSKKNSLVQLVRYVMFVAEEAKKQNAMSRQKWEEEQNTEITPDSVITPAPIEAPNK